MKYLLDTHTFIWSLLDIEKLSPIVYRVLCNFENKIYVSSITFWEIAIKHQLKKITLEPYNIYHFPNYARQQDFNILVPDEYDYIGYTDLPVKKNHRDPFDKDAYTHGDQKRSDTFKQGHKIHSIRRRWTSTFMVKTIA